MTRRAGALLVLLLVAGSAGAAPANPNRAKEELRDLRSRIESLQQKLADSEESRNEAADALRESERAISDANRALSELAQQSRDSNRRLAELEAETAAGTARLKAQQALLARLLYQQYLSGNTGPVKLLLNREDPNQVSRQLHYLSHVSKARAAFIGELRGSLEHLAALAREAAEKAKEIASIAAEQAAQRAKLEQEKRKRIEVHKRISRTVEQQRREIGTLKRDESRLARLVEQLGRIISRAPAARPRTRNESLPEAGSGTGPFADLRGRLSLPVRGELTGRFGSPRSDGGVTWKGLFISARPGDEVKAVAPGRVVYADWLRGFGNLLILDHGDGYMSLYGYNETLLKRVGDTIRAGDGIAAVGNTGGNAESGLYFELRYQGRPFDPLTWVNVR